MAEKAKEVVPRETRAEEIAALLDDNKVHQASEKLRDAIRTELKGANYARLSNTDTKKVTDLLELVSSKDVKRKGTDIELHYDTTNLMDIRVKSWDLK